MKTLQRTVATGRSLPRGLLRVDTQQQALERRVPHHYLYTKLRKPECFLPLVIRIQDLSAVGELRARGDAVTQLELQLNDSVASLLWASLFSYRRKIS